jgi:prepilin-type N-terminal cleavage/methylation domain-containing protein
MVRGMSDREKALGSSGFTLIEVLVALVLIGIGVLAAAPMFVYAMQGNAVAADFGSVGAIAVERMELLRSQDYTTLAPGGSLTSSVSGYSDTSNPDYVVRWQIATNAVPSGTRSVTVRAIAVRRVVGARKEITLTTLRGR